MNGKILLIVAFLAISGFGTIHLGGGGGATGGSVVLSVQSDSYSAAPAPNATIGNLSTTCSASCGSSTYTLVTGTDYAGMACDATTLQITGASLHEATGGNALGTYYPCVQSAQSGAA